MSDAWNRFVHDCRDRYGVGTAAQARAVGVPSSSYYRRTELEGWTQRYPGVRVAPWVRPSPLTELSAVVHAARRPAVASGRTAAWLFGLFEEPPRMFEIAVPHHVAAPRSVAARVRRFRWLDDRDRTVSRRIPTLTPEAAVVSLADGPRDRLRALVIDAQHRGLTDIATIGSRLAAVGPVAGRRGLARLLYELSDRQVESTFHDMVLDELTRRGYEPDRSPVRVPTPDGRGALPDIPLTRWRVAIEAQGDRFHRTRTQRAADRRKTSQYAGSGWLVLQLDWWEWMSNRDHFLAALDAAILAQIRNGAAGPGPLPVHLRGRRGRG